MPTPMPTQMHISLSHQKYELLFCISIAFWAALHDYVSEYTIKIKLEIFCSTFCFPFYHLRAIFVFQCSHFQIPTELIIELVIRNQTSTCANKTGNTLQETIKQQVITCLHTYACARL